MPATIEHVLRYTEPGDDEPQEIVFSNFLDLVGFTSKLVAGSSVHFFRRDTYQVGKA